jgi:hypothetical protein
MNEEHNTCMMVLQQNVSGFLEQAEKEEAVFKKISRRATCIPAQAEGLTASCSTTGSSSGDEAGAVQDNIAMRASWIFKQGAPVNQG